MIAPQLASAQASQGGSTFCCQIGRIENGAERERERERAQRSNAVRVNAISVSGIPKTHTHLSYAARIFNCVKTLGSVIIL